MRRAWRNAGVTDRDARLALTSAIVRRPLASSNELTALEALDVADYLERLDADGVLAERAAAFLAQPPPAPDGSESSTTREADQ